eukprot:278830-Prorocentrum_minimum.AAC.1
MRRAQTEEEYPAPRGGWARCEHHEEQLGSGALARHAVVLPRQSMTDQAYPRGLRGEALPLAAEHQQHALRC